MKFYDNEERELIESFEQTDWKSMKEEIEEYKNLAKANRRLQP